MARTTNAEERRKDTNIKCRRTQADERGEEEEEDGRREEEGDLPMGIGGAGDGRGRRRKRQTRRRRSQQREGEEGKERGRKEMKRNRGRGRRRRDRRKGGEKKKKESSFLLLSTLIFSLSFSPRPSTLTFLPSFPSSIPSPPFCFPLSLPSLPPSNTLHYRSSTQCVAYGGWPACGEWKKTVGSSLDSYTTRERGRATYVYQFAGPTFGFIITFFGEGEENVVHTYTTRSWGLRAAQGIER